MSEKQVEIRLLDSESKLLKKFLGLMETEDTEKICKEYWIESEAYKVDDILYKIYKQLNYREDVLEETQILILISEINKLATLINIKGEHTVFIYNQGHCKEIEVVIHLKKWPNKWDISKKISYDTNYKFFKYEECISELEDMVNELKKLYEGSK